MFTGLIEEKGKILRVNSTIDGKRIVIEAKSITSDLKIGDSVAINGACQTVVEINNNTFAFETVNETLKKTTLKDVSSNSIVNLERAILPTTRMGGHFVQGHIDTCGTILQINKLTNSAEYMFAFPTEFRKYLAHTGSIAIDGVSLTTAQIFDNKFKVALIPHTINSTIFSIYKVGDKVNLEFDVLGKYIESIMEYDTNNNRPSILTRFINQPY